MELASVGTFGVWQRVEVAPSSSSSSSSSESGDSCFADTSWGADVSGLEGSAMPVGWLSSLGATSGSLPFSMVGRYCIIGSLM